MTPPTKPRRGRPKGRTTAGARIGFYLPAWLRARFEARCSSDGLSKSQGARKAIEEWLRGD